MEMNNSSKGQSMGKQGSGGQSREARKKKMKKALDNFKGKMKDAWNDPEKRKDILEAGQNSLSAFTKGNRGSGGDYKAIVYRYQR